MTGINLGTSILIVLFGLFWWYYYCVRTVIDVRFVRVDDCRNLKNSNNHSIVCKNKYCAVKLMNEILRAIRSAENSIDIAMFNFTNHQLIQCVLRASNRGVKIRVLMDKSMLKSNENQTIARHFSEAGE